MHSDPNRMPARFCPGNGHELVGLFAFYCQHHQAWVLYVDGGTCNEPTTVSPPYHAGPFDDFVGVQAIVNEALTDWMARSKFRNR